MVSVCRIVVPASSANIGPGFDSIGIAVGLSITVTVDAAPPGGFAVSITGEGSGILPEDGRNWVLKSAREIAGDATDRAAWEMHSEIPVARGLGSSASARAAGLAAGYMLRDGALPPRHEIFEGVVRTENHPDNAAASVFGGLRVGGRGPAGDWYSWPGVLSGWGVRLLLVIPRIPIATDQARSLLPTSYSRSASVQNLQCLAVLLSGLARGDWEAVRRGLRDHLHEPYRLPLVPGLKEALTALREHPSTGGAYLSGAGPTLAAFLPDPAAGPETAGEALRILKDLGTDAEVQIAALEERGIRVET